MRLGVDTGGTFTDFVWVDGDGRFHIHKQLSTPSDPATAILTGIDSLGVPEAAPVVHGSTVATNALLERRGARTALITTRGFADVLAIGRQNRPDLYALVPQKPAPLVPEKWRFEVDERVTARGEVLVPLDAASLQPVLFQIEREQIESVAVSLLFSFLYPAHEQQIAAALQHSDIGFANEIHLSISSEILPEYREYERTSTTVINAYVAPLMSRYLARLAAELGQRPLAVMQSNGGVISATTAGKEAARTALSGPAGGVVGARYIASQAGDGAGFKEIITFDMGGTSTDVALCPDRLPTTATGEVAGMPLRLPIIDIHTVGAGGGSLAYVDAAGALHVGPQSAGADPGPSCYGKVPGDWHLEIGGIKAPMLAPVTVTDANLVLGRLDADHFLGGRMRLDAAAARAVLTDLGQQMNVGSPEEAAWGVIQVANANMERAIRRISVERGFDPRRFILVPFGGAGPLHACELALNLQIPRVLIPPLPGVLSALGMLVAAPTKDYARTALGEIDLDQDEDEWLRTAFAPLMERAKKEMMDEGYDPERVELQYGLDMRYRGQSHELTIRAGLEKSQTSPRSLFHEAHRARYGYERREAVVEIVTLRLSAVAPVAAPIIPTYPVEGPDAGAALMGMKRVWFKKEPLMTRLYDRDKLRPGNRFMGPAVVFQYDTTSVIPPGWETAVDARRNLVISKR